ncbi:hydantoinase/oxoprolinase family protein [Gilvimarinus xylanilyticus]|uniref:Hydantoinase/oxoprolinase family protein n=1 Tax=Gilvimarinus xylanilyticus TaxID=2944139 RepID=A0A9X2KUL9_9GAMM|nr:hydantoinase/oxoprolinase family protein [Gilvimarinus xylanilyticus]MCP8900434.1 hydantoinase/oxoprolinase family protein [Gilvimarinus xylanilyticus]
MLLGVDTGGTFTDFVLLDGQQLRVHKRLSTPDAPERAILEGIEAMGLSDTARAGHLLVVHGSTVATNAALERKGVPTLYVTNRGLADVLSIGRQTREELYNLTPVPRETPVPVQNCVEVDARLGADGSRLTALTEADIQRLQQAIAERRPEAVAINLLYSFMDDSDEKALQAACPESVFVSRSSFVLPEYGEYERGMATWLNAYLGPKVQGYLHRLAAGVAPSPLGVMQSSGGTIDAAQAAQRAVNLLLSGPAGGLAAAQYLAQTLGDDQSPEKLLTFDMGGTSTDVALIDGALTLTNQGKLGPYPVAVPMVDMHTIGAGGGSIAQVDDGGLLQVGPESAGASPGPACYGRGGKQATVTDANAFLGRLHPDYFLGGEMALDTDSAQRAVNDLAQTLNLPPHEAALGIIRLANEHMAAALRVISVQRGHNPADFRLCCFGGAGGLHVCALADALGMSRALVPVHGGVLSALGMLVAKPERQLSRSLQIPLAHCNPEQLREQYCQLSEAGRAQLQAEGIAACDISESPSLDLRYLGQSFTLNLPYTHLAEAGEAFHRAHEARYGHRLNIDIELVNLRLKCEAPGRSVELPTVAPGSAQPLHTLTLAEVGQTPVYRRTDLGADTTLNGPALIVEQVSTTLLEPGWTLKVDALGNLLLNKGASD